MNDIEVDSVARHPQILSIAVDLLFFPENRRFYSKFILALADIATDQIKIALQTTESNR